MKKKNLKTCQKKKVTIKRAGIKFERKKPINDENVRKNHKKYSKQNK